MVRILRHFRKKGLFLSDFKTYILHIFGEIGLVVLGILIAIQINSWRQIQNNIEEEKQVLISLAKEFESNFLRLDTLLTLKKKQEEQARNFIDIITQDIEHSQERLVNDFPDTFSGEWGATFPNLNSLLVSGRINLIQNEALKILLLDWPARFTLYKQAENRVVISNDELNAYIGNYVPLSLVKKGDATRQDWPGSYFPNHQKNLLFKLIPKLVKDLKFQNHLKELINRLFIQQRAGQNLLKRYVHIMNIIQKDAL